MTRKKILTPLIILVIIPILTLTYLSLSRSLNEYLFAKQELIGADYHAAVYKTLVSAERLRTEMFLDQYPNQEKNVSDLIGNLKANIVLVDEVDKDSASLKLNNEWLALRQSLISEFMQKTTRNSKSQFEHQTKVIAALGALLTKISVQSNMILDPELKTYKTMQLLVENIPATSSLIAFWQAKISNYSHFQITTQAYQFDFIAAVGQLEALQNAHLAAYQMINPTVQSNQFAKPNAYLELAKHLSSYKAIAKNSTAMNKVAFYQEANSTLTTLQTAYILHHKSFKNLLNLRMQSITGHIAIISLMAVLAVLACTTFLFLSQRVNLRLTETNRHFEALFNTVMDALIIIDAKGKIKSVNPATTQIFGYSEAEMLGRNVSMLMPSPSREAHDGYIKNHHETGQAKIIGTGREVIGRRKDGTEFPMALGINQTQVDGQPMFVGLAQDVSARKAAELATLEQKQQMQQLIQNQSVATFLIDSEHRVLHWNIACEALTGVKARDIIGTKESWRGFYDAARPCLANLVLNEQKDKAKDFYPTQRQSTLMDEGWHAEAWFDNLGGKRRYVIFDASPIFDTNGKITAVIETLQDITEMKLVEQALFDETNIAQHALKSLESQKYALDQHALVTVKDLKHRITYANEKFCEISGYSQQELLGKKLDLLDSGQHSEAFFDEMHKAVAEGKVWQNEVSFRNKQGGLFWVNTTLVPFFGDDGEPNEYIAIRTDITERKRLDLELRQAYENLEEFTAVASHDLKSPIRGIADLMDWINEDLGDEVSEDVRKNLDRVKVRVRRMEQLIEDLLLYSRAGKKFAEIASLDPVSMVRDTIELISPPVGFNVTVTGSAKKFNTSVTPLQTCLRNLISNAIKHHDKATGNIEINITNSKGFCVFKVKDDGPGIPQSSHERVFKLFQTLSKSKDSTGLGLAVSKRMVEAHEGYIEIEPSHTERGTTFKVYWPFSTTHVEKKSNVAVKSRQLELETTV